MAVTPVFRKSNFPARSAASRPNASLEMFGETEACDETLEISPEWNVIEPFGDARKLPVPTKLKTVALGPETGSSSQSHKVWEFVKIDYETQWRVF
jgi:hypothetical protein